VVTVGRRTVQAKRAAKKGGQGSSEGVAPLARSKTIKKHRGCGTGQNVSKRQKTSCAATSEVVSSSPEESDHSKSDTETNIEAPSVVTSLEFW
jgi:hypothetical protein